MPILDRLPPASDRDEVRTAALQLAKRQRKKRITRNMWCLNTTSFVTFVSFVPLLSAEDVEILTHGGHPFPVANHTSAGRPMPVARVSLRARPWVTNSAKAIPIRSA